MKGARDPTHAPCRVESGTVVPRDATRPCFAHQGVWHARGSRATADGVTGAVVRSHRLRRCVAPPASVKGATRYWWEEVGVQIRCPSPFMNGSAFQW